MATMGFDQMHVIHSLLISLSDDGVREKILYFPSMNFALDIMQIYAPSQRHLLCYLTHGSACPVPLTLVNWDVAIWIINLPLSLSPCFLSVFHFLKYESPQLIIKIK